MKTTTIYTTSTCASCNMVKQFLTKKGVKYDVINMDDKPEIRQQVIEWSGAMTVPVTIVEDEKGNKNITVGWNPGKIASAVANNV